MAAPASARIFSLALAGSLAVHATVCCARWHGWPAWRAHTPSTTQVVPPVVLTPEMVVESPAQPMALPAAGSMVRAEQEPLPLPPTGFDRRVGIVGSVERPALAPALPEPSFDAHPDQPDVPAIIDLSHLSVELQHNPAYVDYFQTIRERIRYYAQRHYPTGSGSGEVYVYFVVSEGGSLQSVAYDKARSSSDASLRQASLTSVQQAAPFPSFPATFRQPQITFHIIVDYQGGR